MTVPLKIVLGTLVILLALGKMADSSTTAAPSGGSDVMVEVIPAGDGGNQTVEEDAAGGDTATTIADGGTADTGGAANNATGDVDVVQVTMAPSPDTASEPGKDENEVDNTAPDKDTDPGTSDTDDDKMKTPEAAPDVPPTQPVNVPPVMHVPSVHYVSTGPLCVTNADCNLTNAERCSKVREDIRRCECLAGHNRGSDGQKCVASKVYYVELKTEQYINDDLEDHSSEAFRKFKYEATDGAYRALQSSKLSAILVDVAVSQLSTDPDGYIIVKYDVMLLRSYIPDKVVVTTDIRRAFLDKLVPGPNGETLLEGTNIPVTSGAAQLMELRVVNQCANPMLNYCAPTALCMLSARSFTCQCKRGYTDTSPDMHQAPGEKCTLSCDCKNGGECVLDDQGNTKCSCPHWYLGDRCGVDVRILLIVLAAVVAALLLLAIVCCACCLRYYRKRYRVTDDISSAYSLPCERPHLHKVPPGARQCYDTWRYYSFSPPAYNNAGFASGGGKWQTVAHRPPHPSFVACRRHGSEMPMEMVPPTYGTYGPIPRPHILPSASLPRHTRTPPTTSDSQWVWSATGGNEQDSSYA